jgi:cation diffusion facilitator CzcD-associated flavoprotein CzcO
MGNVLPRFLSFSGNPFPAPPSAPTQPFPDLVQTQAYLFEFSRPLRGSIRLNIEVVGVDEVEGEGAGWKVVMKDWSTEGGGKEITEHWDAVVIATAWYDNPKWPDTQGLEGLREAGIARHAREWMGAGRRYGEEFVGKVCFVFHTSCVNLWISH